MPDSLIEQTGPTDVIKPPNKQEVSFHSRPHEFPLANMFPYEKNSWLAELFFLFRSGTCCSASHFARLILITVPV